MTAPNSKPVILREWKAAMAALKVADASGLTSIKQANALVAQAHLDAAKFAWGWPDSTYGQLP